MINDARQAADKALAGTTQDADRCYGAKEFIDAVQEVNLIALVAQNTLRH